MKVKIIIVSVLALTIFSCKKGNGLELEILNKELLSIKSEDKNGSTEFDSIYLSNSKNIVTYKLTNNDDVTYCIIPNPNSRLSFKIKSFPIQNGGIVFYDEKKDTARIIYKTVNLSRPECMDELFEMKNRWASKLNYKMDGYYKEQIDNGIFFIHPNETLFFEYALNLPSGDEFSLGVDFDNKKTYHANIFMYSDTTKYRKLISRTDLRTIEDNNYSLYHGVIKSKNTIPVKFINLKK